MVRSFNWYDPLLTKRIRNVLTALTWTVWILIVYLQYGHIIQVLKTLQAQL